MKKVTKLEKRVALNIKVCKNMCIQTVHEQLLPPCFIVIIVYTVTREQTLAEAYKQKYREESLFSVIYYGFCGFYLWMQSAVFLRHCGLLHSINRVNLYH